MGQVPLKRTTSWNKRRMKRGNLALGVGEANFVSEGFTNVPLPDEDKFMIYVMEDSAPPVVYNASSHSEIYSIIKPLGYTDSDPTAIVDMLQWIAHQNEMMIIYNVDTTSQEIKPFAMYQEQGNNPSINNQWYSIIDPAGFTSLNSGLSEWICMESKTIDYAAPYGGKIYEIDTNNNVSLKGTIGSNPGRGSLSATAGKRYVADKPISLVATANQNAIVPLSYQGTDWGYYFNRYTPPVLYVYAFEDNTTVNIRANDTMVTSFTVNENEVYSYTISSNYSSDFINIHTSKPTVCSARGTSGDKSKLPLAGEYNYRRSNAYERTIINTAPSNALTNVVYDNTNLLSWGISIADGSGGDNEGSLPLEFLSKNYAYGDYLRSFYVVSPYNGNEIDISSWDGSSWVLRNSYTLNGTLTSPVSAQSGSQAGGDRFNNDLMWKFEGSKPFFIVINDDGRDEEVLLGWDTTYTNALYT